MNEFYFGVKFNKDKYTRLDGTTVFTFTADEIEAQPFRITCDRGGINFSGTLKRPLGRRHDLNEFAKLITDAWAEHLKLAPKISSTGVIE